MPQDARTDDLWDPANWHGFDRDPEPVQPQKQPTAAETYPKTAQYTRMMRTRINNDPHGPKYNTAVRSKRLRVCEAEEMLREIDRLRAEVEKLTCTSSENG